MPFFSRILGSNAGFVYPDTSCAQRGKETGWTFEPKLHSWVNADLTHTTPTSWNKMANIGNPKLDVVNEAFRVDTHSR